MSRYKDVDEISEVMDTWPKYGCKPDGRFIKLTKETEADYVPYVHYDDMVQAVTGTPVQDVAPVVHAKWIYEIDDLFPADSMMICSNCGEYERLGANDNYCGNCGAKMDEVVE